MLTTLRSKTRSLSQDLSRISIGGPWEALAWLEALSHLLSKQDTAPKTMRKISFMAHELAAITQHNLDHKSKHGPVTFLEALSHFLFKDKNFQISDNEDLLDESDILLPYVMKNKVGDSRVVGLIYKALAEHFDLPLDLLFLPNICILRCHTLDSNIYVDISDDGNLLSSTELLHRLNGIGGLSEGFNKTYLEPFQIINLVYFLLERLKKTYARATAYEKHLLVLDLLVHQQLAKMHALAERALLLAKMGFQKEALSDLKRYFSFHDVERSPKEIVKTFMHLRATEQKGTRSVLQILD